MKQLKRRLLRTYLKELNISPKATLTYSTLHLISQGAMYDRYIKDFILRNSDEAPLERERFLEEMRDAGFTPQEEGFKVWCEEDKKGSFETFLSEEDIHPECSFKYNTKEYVLRREMYQRYRKYGGLYLKDFLQEMQRHGFHYHKRKGFQIYHKTPSQGATLKELVLREGLSLEEIRERRVRG